MCYRIKRTLFEGRVSCKKAFIYFVWETQERFGYVVATTCCVYLSTVYMTSLEKFE